MQLKSNEDKEWAKELWKEDDIGQNENKKKQRMRKIVKCMQLLLLFGWFGVGFWRWLASDTMSTLFIWNKARISKTKEKTNSHTHTCEWRSGPKNINTMLKCSWYWSQHTLHTAPCTSRHTCTMHAETERNPIRFLSRLFVGFPKKNQNHFRRRLRRFIFTINSHVH